MTREIRFVTKTWKHPKDKNGEYISIPLERMPNWKKKNTLLMMYECIEDTPISPALETPEKLAKWLADNGASYWGYETASYEKWLERIYRLIEAMKQ